MQNLDAVAAKLGTIAAAFKDGGLYFLLGVGLFLAYLVLMAALKRRRQATQEVNVNLPPAAPQTGNGTSKLCPMHSGIEAQVRAIERSAEATRQENSSQHRQLFDGLQDVAVNIASLTAAIKK